MKLERATEIYCSCNFCRADLSLKHEDRPPRYEISRGDSDSGGGLVATICIDCLVYIRDEVNDMENRGE